MIKKKLFQTAGVALATTVAAGLFGAAPAYAQQSSDGRVVSAGNLSVRYGPSQASAWLASLAPDAVIPIHCKIRGSSVDGNNVWYALPPTLNEWVSARYVVIEGPEPDWCGSDQRFVGRTSATLIQRTGPTSVSPSVGTLSRGTTVNINCKLQGQNVRGNDLWYHLDNGRWVSAYYVDNIGQAPSWCN